MPIKSEDLPLAMRFHWLALRAACESNYWSWRIQTVTIIVRVLAYDFSPFLRRPQVKAYMGQQEQLDGSMGCDEEGQF